MQWAIPIDSWGVFKNRSKIRISLSKSKNILRRTVKLDKSLRKNRLALIILF